MPERTRQRQGRDFNSVVDYLRNAEMSLEGNYNMVGDGIINNVPLQKPFHDDEANQKSLLIKLDQAKDAVAEQETERGTQGERNTPVDGHEPPERGRY